MRRVSAVAVVVAVLGAPALARAYCQQTTHDDDTCKADPGVPLVWEGNCVPYSVYQAGSDDLPLSTVLEVVRVSFEAWEDAAFPGQERCSYLTFSPTELATCDQIGYRQEGGNMNLVYFREAGWTAIRNHAPAAMGLTTVLFDPGSGEILSSDMELNGENFHFSADPDNVDADLQNTVTHEAGHVLGLAHTPDTEATMYGTSTNGETKKSTLEEDDIRAVCDMYPIAQDPGVCNQPHGGLDPACLPPDGGCCRVAGGAGGGARDAAGVALTALLALALARRARRHGRP